MNVESVQCNHCGAPLEIPESARFVTCRHCNSSLAVHRSASVVSTEVLQQMSEQVGRVAQEVEKLRLENSLQRLDQSWERDQQQFYVKTKHGKQPPSAAGGIVTIVVSLGMALVFGSTAASQGFGAGVLISVLIAGIGIFAGVHMFRQADQLDAARRRYQIRRASLVQNMHDADQNRGATHDGQESG
ncbi:MAG: hypothetical protein U0935_24275 [Pirellulales bacterium]